LLKDDNQNKKSYVHTIRSLDVMDFSLWLADEKKPNS